MTRDEAHAAPPPPRAGGTDTEVGCRCGSLGGRLRDLRLSRVNRLVCFCDDCQAFADLLLRRGYAGSILDANGGTEIAQLSPAHLELSRGTEHLACLRLSEAGIVRWYARCCHTPIGNTLDRANVPFVGLIHSFLAGPVERREAAIGPIRDRVFAADARGDLGGIRASQRPSLGSMLRLAYIILGAWLRGDRRRSPFFDPATGEIRARPEVVGEEELRAVRRTSH